MKYLLTFVVDQSRMSDASPEEMKPALEAWKAFDAEAIEAGAMIACEPLEDASLAKTIRVSESGERTTTDGPFAETKEQLGGFALLECSGLDEALEWASKVPLGEGSIEVRAVMDFSQYGYESPTVRPAGARA
jgi:hypothetical protein